MKKNKIYSLTKKISGDLITPVGIYLKIRDRFREPLLLESSDYHSGKNSKSFICFEPLKSILIKRSEVVYRKGAEIEKRPAPVSLSKEIELFLSGLDLENKS